MMPLPLLLLLLHTSSSYVLACITERLEPQEHVSGWVASISGQALRLKVVAHSKSQQHSSLAPRLLPTLLQTQSAFSPY